MTGVYPVPQVNRHSFAEVKAAAQGLWPGIAISAGIPPEALNGRNQPCPGCGGRDRFRFIDKKGDGFFVCGGGGERTAGDGFRLLEHVRGWSASESLHFVADYLGLAGREITQADRDAYRQRRILEALAHELEVLRLAVADRLAQRAHSPEDAERERVAIERVQRGLAVMRD